MANNTTIHVVPAAGGEWAVQAQDDRESSVHPTRGLAVAKAWEMVESRATAEVVVHDEDGAIYSNLLIRRHELTSPDDEFLDEASEEALRREALRITPSRAELHEMIGRLPVSSIDYSTEDDELPC